MSEKLTEPVWTQRNKEPILAILKEFIGKEKGRLLEVGAGVGHHTLFFAKNFPALEWVPSERAQEVRQLRSHLSQFSVKNIKEIQTFCAGKDKFPKLKFEYVYTANTLHIMSWKEVKSLLKDFKNHLRPGAKVLIYGPFKYDGNFTTPSNEDFDKWLKERDPKSGIRNFEDIQAIMIKNGFSLLADRAMPANNQMLIFKREEVVI